MTEPSTGPVLLIEDDRILADALERYLDAHGFDIRRAGSAEEARAMLDRGLEPCLVVLDVNLPGETGWSLLRDSALTAPNAPPVLVATATTVSPRKLHEHRVAGYLPKPFPMETFLHTIERALGRDTAEGEE